MADFPSSSAVGGDAGRAAANPISLAHVLALSVPVHWTEAVAVVEELCLVLSAAGGERALVPDPQDVLITAQGALMMRRGAPMTLDVETIGRLLNALLDPVTTPIPLRLFVAHSIGSEKYRSVTSYGEALAYYARPDRTELIQALYRRCLESSATVLPIIPEATPLEPLPRELTPQPTPLVKRRKIPRWLPAAAAAVLLLVAAYFGVRHLTGGSALSPVGTAIVVAAKAMQSVRQLVTPAPAPPVVTAAGPVEAETALPSRTRRVVTSSASNGTSSSGRAVSATSGVLPPQEPLDTGAGTPPSSPLSGPPVLTQTLPLDAGAVNEGALALAPVATSTPIRSVVSETSVYTSTSRDVLPPIMYSPKLPPLPPAEPDLLGTNTMELLIDEAGIVQQVRLTSRPVRLPDMLLLSAAKTWKFYPALKDGQPVQYRLSLSWIVAPP